MQADNGVDLAALLVERLEEADLVRPGVGKDVLDARLDQLLDEDQAAGVLDSPRRVEPPGPFRRPHNSLDGG